MQPDAFFYNFIAIHEGGLSNNPNDKGGLTNKGITWQTFKALSKKVLDLEPTEDNFRSLTAEQFRKIVDYFWNASKANYFNNRNIANIYANSFWGSGKWAASILVKAYRSLGYKKFEDKGSKTSITKDLIDYGNTIPANELYAAFTKYQIKFYNDIVKADKTQSQFLAGWLNRANDLYNSAKMNWGNSSKKSLEYILILAASVALYKYLIKPMQKQTKRA